MLGLLVFANLQTSSQVKSCLESKICIIGNKTMLYKVSFLSGQEKG